MLRGIARYGHGKPYPDRKRSPRQGAVAPRTPERSAFLVPNRTRNKAVTLRMTEEEYAFFREQMEKAQEKNQTDFFLAVLRKKKIVVVDDLSATLTELKRQGNNLNQIARQLHEGTPLGDGTKMILKSCYAAYKKLIKLELK